MEATNTGSVTEMSDVHSASAVQNQKQKVEYPPRSFLIGRP